MKEKMNWENNSIKLGVNENGVVSLAFYISRFVIRYRVWHIKKTNIFGTLSLGLFF